MYVVSMFLLFVTMCTHLTLTLMSYPSWVLYLLTPLKPVQLRTTKVNKLSISGTRFFGRNLMTVLKLDRQKELKNGVFMLFPRVFGNAKILSKFFCILHRHLSQSLRKILLIKLISITLCMSISSPESSASLASFFLCNWCDSRDLVISSSSSPSLTV